MKVCFILDHALLPYREPFFKDLGKRGYELTIVHSGRQVQSDLKQIRLASQTFFGIELRKLPKLNDFDIVVHMQNLRFLSFWLISLNPFRNYKLIHWGIGVSSSKGLSKQANFISIIRNILSKRADAVVLYSDFPLELFSRTVRAKTFVANNTIHNPFSADFSPIPKKHFLFIGTLNARKGLDVLIKCFAEFISKSPTVSIRKLVIIGDGPEKSSLVQLSKSLALDLNVEFTGSISDDERKREFFSEAIASFSLRQAGLSVLESFSYGVPFVCFKNAISGGEHLNVIDNVNGFLAEGPEDIVRIMDLISSDRDLAKRIGGNAFQYFSQNRSMEAMVDGFQSCFQFVKNK